jgi:outer membrane receptor protein involved in Fe transport
VLDGNIPFLDILATDVTLRPLFDNYSAIAQDTWRLGRRLTLTYGLRYEVNPPPSEKNGNLLLTVNGLNNLFDLSLASRGARLYETTFNNFAPRLGVAYQLFPERGTVLQGVHRSSARRAPPLGLRRSLDAARGVLAHGLATLRGSPPANRGGEGRAT